MSQAAEVEDGAGKNILRIHAADRIAARVDTINLVNGIPDDNGMTNHHIFHGVGIADGRGDAARHICFTQFRDPRFPKYLIFDNGAALDLHVSVGHIETATSPVPDIQQTKQKTRECRRFDKIPGDGAIFYMNSGRQSDTAAIRVHTTTVGKKSGNSVFGDR